MTSPLAAPPFSFPATMPASEPAWIPPNPLLAPVRPAPSLRASASFVCARRASSVVASVHFTFGMMSCIAPVALERCALTWSACTSFSSSSLSCRSLPLMSMRTTRGVTSTSMSDVSRKRDTPTSSTMLRPSSLSSSENFQFPSFFWYASSGSSGSGSNPVRRGFAFPLDMSPSASLLVWSRFWLSAFSRSSASSRCSSTRVAADHGRESSSTSLSRSTSRSSSSSSSGRSRASSTLRAASTSTPSASSSRTRRASISAKFCFALMRSEGGISLPSNRFSDGTVAITKSRYPSKSLHGLPIKNKSRSW
mmetsp:Transcript_22360/g.72553  ORF Transcript_22360/g.72553 Transcript_22360/m.72553 type:complete len:308 (-) Transcript_22360:861-1784(-)